MTTISVVQYNTSPHKLNVLQQTTINNNKDPRREVIVLRKPQAPILPLTTKAEAQIASTAKKKRSEAPSKPAQIAVARRNARERNRVKQVNNGFANLRQHIPNSIAAAFESNSGRGNKKLSKVETLRMAVEYIRSLEDILAGSTDSRETYPSGNDSAQETFFPSPSSSSSQNYSYPLLSPSADEDDLSTNPTPPPQQYIRIPGSNSYQLIPAHLYEESENLEPLDDHLLTSALELSGVQDLSLLNSIQTNASLSPEMYSDSSLSPTSLDKSDPHFIPVFNTRHLDQPSNEKLPSEMAFRLEDAKFRGEPIGKTKRPEHLGLEPSDSLVLAGRDEDRKFRPLDVLPPGKFKLIPPGLVQGGPLQEGLLQVGSLQVRSLQGGSLQDGSIQDGSIQDGSIQEYGADVTLRLSPQMEQVKLEEQLQSHIKQEIHLGDEVELKPNMMDVMTWWESQTTSS